MKQVGRYAVVGFELAGSIGVGFFGGRWLDAHFGTHLFVWIGLVVGTFAGFRTLFVTARDAQKALDAEDAADEAAGRGKGSAPQEEEEDDDRPN